MINLFLHGRLQKSNTDGPSRSHVCLKKFDETQQSILHHRYKTYGVTNSIKSITTSTKIKKDSLVWHKSRFKFEYLRSN